MNLVGIVFGAISFLIIGLWHPIVIRGEYYLGKRICAWLFLAVGMLCLGFSLCVTSDYLSLVLALFAFSAFWGIREVYEQERRVERGWFPKNPKRENNTQENNNQK